jgi:hypothetical protein
MGTSRILSGLAVLALVLVQAAPLLGAERLGRRVRSERFGYSLAVLESFSEIPVPPKETRLVGRYLGERTYFGQAGLRVLRYPKPVAEPVSTDPAKRYGDKKEDEKKEGEEDEKPKDPFEADSLYATLRILAGDVVGDAKKIEVGDQVGRLFEYDFNETSYLACAVPTRDGGEFGLFYWAPQKTYRKDFRAAFYQSARSLRMFEPDVLSPAEVELMDPIERSRMEKKRLIEGVPGWYAFDTENYVVLSNSTDHELVRHIGRSIERLRGDVYMDLFPPIQPITAISVVRVCSTRDEYHRYGGPGGSAGYWNSGTEELVFYDRFPNMSRKKSRENSLSVLYHEAFHQYIFYAFGEISPHSWFNEGHGDYFAGADFGGSKVRIDPFRWRVPRVKEAERADRLVPLDKFVRYTQKEYYKNAGQNYAQGWAFIYFLRRVTRDEAYRNILPTYFRVLQEEVTAIDRGERTLPVTEKGGEGKDGAEPGDDGPPEPGDPADPGPPVDPGGKPGGDGKEPGGEGGPTAPPDDPPGDPPSDGQPPGDDAEETGGEVAPPSEKKQRDPRLVKMALEKAVDAALEGIDVERLEKEFHHFIRRGL